MIEVSSEQSRSQFYMQTRVLLPLPLLLLLSVLLLYTAVLQQQCCCFQLLFVIV